MQTFNTFMVEGTAADFQCKLICDEKLLSGISSKNTHPHIFIILNLYINS